MSKYVVPVIGVELVVVFIGHMHNETGVSLWVQTLGEGLDALEIDGSLKLGLLHIVQLQIGEHEGSFLLHSKSVFLKEDARENN